MSEKKHIDRLFQEGFKDFESQPSDAVWKNIESKLNHKKKKRRVIPLWWRYAGVAALLLLFLTIGGLYINNSNNETSNPQVVDSESTRKTNPNNPSNTSNNQNIEAVAAENTATDDHLHQKKNNNVNFTSSEVTSIAQTPTSDSDKTNSNHSPINTYKGSNTTKPSNSDAHVALAKRSKENNNNAIHYNQSNRQNTKVAANNETDNTNSAVLIDKEETQKLIKASGKQHTELVKTKETSTSEEVSDNQNSNPITIEEALENNKDLLKEEITNKQNRWSIAPNAAPVYFNTLGEGSSIDPQFSSNSKTGEVNMSYGIAASYAVNNKIKIRSGINKVNLGYNTNDIILYQSVGLSSNNSALQNINSGNTSGYSVVSSESIDAKDLPQTLLSSNTTINQAFGYIEVPLEIQYTLSDKKFGVNVIGGFSSFFLDNNEVYSKAENGPRVFLGEANNINKISYSANFGLGLNYEVSKTFDLNLEPMFKYQFNTFNNTSGNFTPFFIGVYTGFAIKF
ncbi:hypothetical protein GSB9_02205 [Flavobacteriaceae bacterium GSB9]|nr:hypothetical protein GSB9_02205 [Flavobacteriaceae bacterium GSB9]